MDLIWGVITQVFRLVRALSFGEFNRAHNSNLELNI